MISVVICSIDTSKYTRAARMYERLLRSTDFEIIAIHDATGMAEGYNRGLAQSRGDLIFFSHDDVEFLTPDFLDRVLGHMVHCDVLGVAGTRRLTSPDWLLPGLPYAYGQMAYPNFDNTGHYAVVMWSVPARRIDHVQAMDGVFLCARRSVAQQVRFDQTNFTGFHLYDSDFTYRAFLAGHKLSIAADLYPLHTSGGDQSRAWHHAATRFIQKFGSHLTRQNGWLFRHAQVVVPTLAEVLEVMTPPHWADHPELAESAASSS